MYSFTCVCGENLTTTLTRGYCRACHRPFRLDWRAEQPTPQRPETLTPEVPAPTMTAELEKERTEKMMEKLADFRSALDPSDLKKTRR